MAGLPDDKREASSLWAVFKADLRSFTRIQLLWTAVFAAFSLIFSFVDFNQLTSPVEGASAIQWINDTNNGVALWKRILYLLSGLASFTGVLSVVFAAKQRISTFIWGIPNCLFYGAFAMAYGYAGDAQLNIVFFLPFQFVGICLWSKHSADAATHGAGVTSRSLAVRGWLTAALAAGALWTVLYYEIPAFSQALTGEPYVFQDKPTPHILDAASVAFSCVAQVLLLGRFWEQWIFWLSVDGVAYGVDYISINILTMWCFYFCNALFGLCTWHSSMRRDACAAAACCANGADTTTKSVATAESPESFSSPAEAGSDLGGSPDTPPDEEQGAARQPLLSGSGGKASGGREGGSIGGNDGDGGTGAGDGGGSDGGGGSGGGDGGGGRGGGGGVGNGGRNGGDGGNWNSDGGDDGGGGRKDDSGGSDDRNSGCGCAGSAGGGGGANDGGDNGKDTYDFDHAIIAGKFYPAHGGHRFLIDTARRRCRIVHLFLCGKVGEDPSPELREAWLLEMYPPGRSRVLVIRIDDVYDPDDSRVWADNCVRWTGFTKDQLARTCAFTSEPYGELWARLMGCHHILVDQPRATFPVSGTAVRARPLENWRFLHACMRNFYAARIAVVGAESTGKTVLAARLAARFETRWVPEYGRGYCAEKTVAEGKDAVWGASDFEAIVRGQAATEAAAARKCDRIGLLVCDTDAVTTTLWHDALTAGRPEAPERRAAVRQLAAAQRPAPALYLLCRTEGAPFVDDGTRDEARRARMDAEFPERLAALRGIPVVALAGTWEEREKAAVAAVEAFLRAAGAMGAR